MVRLVGIALSLVLYGYLPGRPLFAADQELGLAALAAFAIAVALTWSSLTAVRRVRPGQFRDGVAEFFLGRAMTAQGAGLAAGVLILATPIAEELFFRGVLSPLTHPVLSVVVFAIVHEGFALKLIAAAFGVFTEACASMTGTLEVSIAIHAAVNWAAFVYFRVRVHLLETSDEVRMLL